MNTTHILTLFTTGAASVVLLTGCVTPKPNRLATVCPECKIVIEESYDPYSDTTDVRTTRAYSCPGCQGALTTFFHEGQLQHKCSVCSQSPYRCPLSHPRKSSASTQPDAG